MAAACKLSRLIGRCCEESFIIIRQNSAPNGVHFSQIDSHLARARNMPRLADQSVGYVSTGGGVIARNICES